MFICALFRSFETKAKLSVILPVVCPHVTDRKSVKSFLWNLILENFTKKLSARSSVGWDCTTISGILFCWPRKWFGWECPMGNLQPSIPTYQSAARRVGNSTENVHHPARASANFVDVKELRHLWPNSQKSKFMFLWTRQKYCSKTGHFLTFSFPFLICLSSSLFQVRFSYSNNEILVNFENIMLGRRSRASGICYKMAFALLIAVILNRSRPQTLIRKKYKKIRFKKFCIRTPAQWCRSREYLGVTSNVATHMNDIFVLC